MLPHALNDLIRCSLVDNGPFGLGKQPRKVRRGSQSGNNGRASKSVNTQLVLPEIPTRFRQFQRVDAEVDHKVRAPFYETPVDAVSKLDVAIFVIVHPKCPE